MSARPISFTKSMDEKQMDDGYMIISSNAVALCKEQERTKNFRIFFGIQTIGLEQDGPLLKKEAQWKK
jgi:hypothetical protein